MRRLARKRTTKAVRPGENQNHVFETQTVALAPRLHMVETFDPIHVNPKPWQLHQGPCILEPRKPPRWQEKNSTWQRRLSKHENLTMSGEKLNTAERTETEGAQAN